MTEQESPNTAVDNAGAEPCLIVLTGQTQNPNQPLTRSATVFGQARGCHIRLNSEEVSQVHCMITRTATGLVLTDRASRIGTLVNGEPVSEVVLRDDDLLQIGAFRFRVSAPPEGPAAEAAGESATGLPDPGVEAVRNELEAARRQIAGVEEELGKARGDAERWREAGAENEQLEEKLRQVIGQAEQYHEQLRREQERLAEIEGAVAEKEELEDKLREVIGKAEQFHQRLTEESARREQLESELATARTSGAAGEPSDDSDEVTQLRARLEAQHEQEEQRLKSLRGELEKERMRFKELVKESALQHGAARRAGSEQGSEDGDPEKERLQAEVTQLRTQVADLQSRAEAGGAPMLPAELQEYEGQLNDYRQQLEQAQQSLQQQEQELNEKLKQSELDLSKERATIARERSNIERTHGELMRELEHAERDAARREKLAPLQKLQDDLRGKNPDAQPETESTSLANRIRGLLKRMGNG